MHGWTTRSLPPRALRLAPILCAVLVAALVLPATRAWAAEAERPTIDSQTPNNQTIVSATVEAQINPRGAATTYAIRLLCQEPYPGPSNCEELQVSGQPQTGHIAAGFGDQAVTADFTGLHGSRVYHYVVVATNSMGTSQAYGLFQTLPVGACPTGCPWLLQPYESKMTPGGEAVLRGAAEETEAIQRGYVEREAKEQAEREAAAKAKQQSAAAPSNPPITAPSSVSLASTAITVQSGHVSQIHLECLGAASCNGKLTLSAKIATKAKGAKKHSRTLAIGTANFSIPGDETETVKLDINATGRVLLSADHGRLSASLAILELAPSPESTVTKAVQLIQQLARVKRSK